MVTLYITRHGETVWNTQKRMQGWLDSDLTEKGIQNAKSLGDRLKDISFEAAYISPSGRTRATSNLILGDRNIPLIFDENLREMNLGSWEGETLQFIKESYPVEYDRFWNAPHLYTPIGGEYFTDIRERATQVLNKIKTKHTDGNILIVTHSVMIKSLLSIIKDLSIENLWEPPFIHDTSLTIVESRESEYRIILEGDNSHKELLV
ncbi:histidine phosphatase family protein [Bacillus sp. BGMRC 2118]|nr:histidine phosphatase family protein [Bacillus sp. BGMRC 2118]